AGALQPDDIEAAQLRPVADSHAVGNYVAHNGGTAAEERAAPHADKLMNCCEPTDNDVIADLAMSAERCAVRKRDIVADDAVMRHMRVCKEETVGADGRRTAAAIRTDIHRHGFAYVAVFADGQRRAATLVLGILRWSAKRGERLRARIRTDGGCAGHGDVAGKVYIVTKHDLRAHMAKGADMDTGAQLRARFHESGLVDEGFLGHDPRRLSLPASATSLPISRPRPLSYLRRLPHMRNARCCRAA